MATRDALLRSATLVRSLGDVVLAEKTEERP
jgi:hypothetical protein